MGNISDGSDGSGSDSGEEGVGKYSSGGGNGSKVKSKGLRHVDRDVYSIAGVGRLGGKYSDTVL